MGVLVAMHGTQNRTTPDHGLGILVEKRRLENADIGFT